MRRSEILVAAFLSIQLPTAAFGRPCSAFVPASTTGTDELAAEAFRNLVQFEKSIKHGYGDLPGHGNWSQAQRCSVATASRRREWDTLSAGEKEAYIDAVLCLMSKPSISGALAPGAKSRYDDFAAVHINQTLSIHGTGKFLSWHRYFTWTYEQALRHECGYDGSQPYLNWGRYAHDLLRAPVFDGSATSLSGNGAPDPANNGTNIPSNATPYIALPPGRGGGCVTSGPFAAMQVNLGPRSPALPDVRANPRADGLGENPRCLRRDLSAYAAARWATDANVTDLVRRSAGIGAFQDTMQGDFAAGLLGVHTAGHFFVGGDPGGDLFASPGDPYFFLHHAQVDRVWWIWQNLRPAERVDVIAGTVTINNVPPSRNATLQDVIELGVNAGGIRIREAVSTLDGPFCYIYE